MVLTDANTGVDSKARCLIIGQILVRLALFLSYGCLSSVFLPDGAIDQSVISDLGISWSYSLFFATFVISPLI